MRIQGRRLHIAGSASPASPTDKLRYAHALIEALVDGLARRGARFVVGVGKEPLADESDPSSPSIIFDWTVLETASGCLNQGMALPTGQQGKLIATVATDKTARQIPAGRQDLWQNLLKAGAVHLLDLPPGLVSGALRRSRLAELGDVLVVLSGGEGVEHLAREYALQNKPVIPFDLDIGASQNDGSGGAAMLARIMRAQSERFVRLTDRTAAGALLARMSTRDGQAPVAEVVQAAVELIEQLSEPRAFYVRLLNGSNEHYPAVERFFRAVVDPFVKGMGYEPIEMGRSLATRAWINDEIFTSIHDSALVVVDLTALRPNCFIELGYALGLPRKLIVAAQKGTELPFDVHAFDCYLWDSSPSDEQRLKELEGYWWRNLARPPLVKPQELL